MARTRIRTADEQKKVDEALRRVVDYIQKFEEVIRKAAEIEFDEGNPKEIFDRIGLRPYINAELGRRIKRERVVRQIAAVQYEMWTNRQATKPPEVK